MRTACLETVRAPVSVATTRCCLEGGPQKNKFEEVSSDHHQISPLGAHRCPERGQGVPFGIQRKWHWNLLYP